MSISIVIPFSNSRWAGNPELKYALRSIEKHLSNYGDIFIIGDKPQGLKNYIHIPYESESQRVWKERNIYRKVMAAIYDVRVTDDFLYMNDDHFLLSSYDAYLFPNYYHEWPVKSDMYAQTIENTKIAFEYARRELKLVRGNDVEVSELFFDVHCPIRMNKHHFATVNSVLNWDKKPGYCMKSLYCNILSLEGIYYPDLKIRLQHSPYDMLRMIKNRLFFSTDDHARGDVLEGLLKSLYSDKSKYEV